MTRAFNAYLTAPPVPCNSRELRAWRVAQPLPAAFEPGRRYITLNKQFDRIDTKHRSQGHQRIHHNVRLATLDSTELRAIQTSTLCNCL